jgi:hypothetical protein
MSAARPFGLTDSEMEQKRAPGTISQGSGNWVVIEESERTKGGYMHHCGTLVRFKVVNLRNRVGSGGRIIGIETVPFCPKCEREPGSGYKDLRGKMVII